MKPRHVAALALVVWYLMQPPLRTSTLMPSTRTLPQLCGDGRGLGASLPSRNARPTAPTHGNGASPATTRASRKNSDDRTAGGSSQVSTSDSKSTLVIRLTRASV
jgi:hypothetical protein